MKSRNDGFRITGHTADIGLKIWGADLKGFFRNALRGLLEIIKPSGKGSGPLSVKVIRISSPDTESLLVDFLNELIFLINVRQWIPAGIRKMNVSSKQLTAELEGHEDISGEKETEIKAATYHNLNIKADDVYMSTVVIFDI